MGDNEDQVKNTFLGLVETHEKYNRIDWGDNVVKLDQYRDIEDKKGGGIKMFTKDKEGVQLVKEETNSKDVMPVSLDLNNIKIVIVIVYIDFNKKTLIKI